MLRQHGRNGWGLLLVSLCPLLFLAAYVLCGGWGLLGLAAAFGVLLWPAVALGCLIVGAVFLACDRDAVRSHRRGIALLTDCTVLLGYVVMTVQSPQWLFPVPT